MPRDALFDAAVNRALEYATRLGIRHDDAGALRQGLEVWYLKTRFAYRVPLEEVLGALGSCPNPTYHWQGGREGSWQPPSGRAPAP